MLRREIANNVFFTEIEGNYKRSRLSIYMASPLSRHNLTTTAMLPFVLERGTASLPDVTLLKRRQNALYGANLSTNYYSIGLSRIIEGYIEGVDSSLVACGASISDERIKLLLDVLYDPHVVDGGFDDGWIDIEREKLREAIQSVINDKRDYCAKLLTEAFFDDERALPVDGFEDDLAGIDGKTLYRHYKDFIAGSRLEIIYAGLKQDGLEDMILDKIGRGGFDAKPIKAMTAVTKREEQHIVNTLEVEQDKLALAFTAGRVFDKKDMMTLRVASAIFGAAPTSRLFVNVREKQSLCYYVLSQPNYKAAGGLIVESGVDRKDVERAKSSILKELNKLAKDGPTDTEMEQAKLLFANVLKGVSDSSAALTGYYFSSLMRYNEIVSPEEELEIINGVTAEEVKKVLAEMNLNTSCRITSCKPKTC